MWASPQGVQTQQPQPSGEVCNNSRLFLEMRGLQGKEEPGEWPPELQNRRSQMAHYEEVCKEYPVAACEMVLIVFGGAGCGGETRSGGRSGGAAAAGM